MAKKPIPSYKESDKTYHADACEPLAAAAASGKVAFHALARSSYPGRPLRNSELTGLQSAGYWDAKREQDWGLPLHRNEGIELTFLETGAMSFSTGGKTWRLTPGSLAITRPWQPHQVGRPNVGIGRLHWIILDVGVRQPHQQWKWPDWLVLSPADLAELTGILRENEQPTWRASEGIAACFRQIGRAVETEAGASRLAVFINELFLDLLDLFRSEPVPRDKALTGAQRSVELFLGSLAESCAEPWTLDEMARNCGLGVTRFVHYCHLVSNLTPMQHLTHLRTAKAADLLLRDPGKSVTDIAFECGFSSSQYFATCFRKHHGQSPAQFRSEQRILGDSSAPPSP